MRDCGWSWPASRGCTAKHFESLGDAQADDALGGTEVVDLNLERGTRRRIDLEQAVELGLPYPPKAIDRGSDADASVSRGSGFEEHRGSAGTRDAARQA